MNGDIKLQSIMGEGSAFEVRIPVVKADDLTVVANKGDQKPS